MSTKLETENSKSVQQQPQIDIAKYRDYREYLKDWYAAKKATRKTFSLRAFAKKAGFASPASIKLVMDGKKNLSIDSADAVATAMNLSNDEKSYFVSLIQLNAAQTKREKEDAERNLRSALVRLKTSGIDAESTEDLVYQWYFGVIAVLATIKGFQPTGKWIGDALHNRITPEQAERAFKEILDRKIIERQPDGTYKTTNILVSLGANAPTPPKPPPTIPLGTLNVIKDWNELLPSTLPHERSLNTLLVPMNSKKIETCRAKIRECADELVALCEELEDPNQVYYLAIYFLPATAPIKR